MNTWIDNPAFGIALSILCYQVGTFIFNRTRMSFFNPLLISIILIIIILEIFHIPYDTYAKGGNIINFLLAPVTVALALPMYQHWKQVRIYILPILIGVSTGCLFSIGGVILIGKFMGLDTSLINSLTPKSITTPMGIALSEAMGGNPSITVAAIVFTGILGAVIAPWVMKIFRIKSKVAKGIGIGTAAHAVGTSKAMEMGKLEGAMSSAAIGIAGVITVLLAPFLIPLIERWIH
jgi:predicted murein hydrolase (TIGR00659 family)